MYLQSSIAIKLYCALFLCFFFVFVSISRTQNNILSFFSVSPTLARFQPFQKTRTPAGFKTSQRTKTSAGFQTSQRNERSLTEMDANSGDSFDFVQIAPSAEASGHEVVVCPTPYTVRSTSVVPANTVALSVGPLAQHAIIQNHLTNL